MEDQTGRESAATLDAYEDLHPGGAPSGEGLQEMEPALPELLQSIREGAQTLVESRAEDARLSRELCVALAAYTRGLEITLEVPPEAIPKFHDAEKMFLSPEGHLVVVDRRGRVNSKALEEYPPEMVLIVVWNALPQLKSKIAGFTERLARRVDILERIGHELRGLPIQMEKPGEDP